MKRKIIAFMFVIIMLMSFHTTAVAAVEDWNITKGFGTVKGTGAGLSMEEDVLTVGGYGEMLFTQKRVEEALAVQFKVTAYPKVTHYFYFGLVDSQQLWETSGAKAKGIINRVVVSNNGQTLSATTLTTTASAGTLSVNKADSTMKAVEVSHMLVMEKQMDNWCITIDGVEVAKVPHATSGLKDLNYIIAGAYSSSTMEMQIQGIFVDEEVTSEMRDGSYISKVAGDEGRVDVYYDDEGKLIMGDTIITGGTEAPSYIISSLQLETTHWGKPLVPYFLMGAGVTAAVSIVIFVCSAIKKKPGKKEEHHEE